MKAVLCKYPFTIKYYLSILSNFDVNIFIVKKLKMLKFKCSLMHHIEFQFTLFKRYTSFINMVTYVYSIFVRH